MDVADFLLSEITNAVRMRFKDKYGYEASEHTNVLTGITKAANKRFEENNAYRETSGRDVTDIRMAWPWMVKA